MFVIASADPDMLDRWRAALGERAATVEVRRADALTECLARLQPQLMLLDVALAHVHTVRVVADLVRRSPGTWIVALADGLDEEQELALFRAGVRGVCALDCGTILLNRVVNAVLRGELWIRRPLVSKLIDSLNARPAELHGVTGRFAILTPREIEIAKMIGEGASNKHIARHLSITEQTVKGHLTAIFRKIGVDDRLRLALLVAGRH
jgi:two-component system nitrate/nitrite response regulator NarL